MTERKEKRTSETVIEVGSEDMPFVIEPSHVEIGAGYTVAVSHDEDERQVIDVKTYGQVNIAHLRREISRAFPNAEIRRFNQSHSVTVVKSEKRKNKRKRK
jgi:hypothetical protein